MRRTVALVMVLSGCSFVFVSHAPEHAKPDASCTETNAAPIVDTVLAASLLLAGIIGANAHGGCSYTSQNDCTASNVGQGVAQDIGAALVVSSLPFMIAAARGYSATSECRRLHRAAVATP